MSTVDKSELPLPERIRKIEQLRQAHIELDGNREMILDGCKGILEYSDEKIRICTDGCTVGVSGDNLLIKNYNESQLFITGKIIALEFS
jgi:sporulation protein YqfC